VSARLRAMLLALCALTTAGALVVPAAAATDGAAAGYADAEPALEPGVVLAQDAEQGFTGTLRDGDGEPVQGVTITVLDADGNEVGSAESDADGQWQVTVESGGDYQILLDEETLPEGVDLRDPDRNPLEVTLQPGRVRPAIFALGEGGAGRGNIEAFFRALANGLKFGLIIAMCAVGLSLIFGTTGLINFAHGELVALGAMLAWFFNVGNPRLQLLAGAGIAVVLTAGFGGLLERGMFRPLRKRRLGTFQLVVITIGLSLLVRHVLLVLFGGAPRPFRDYIGQSVIQIGPVALTPRDMAIMLISATVLVGVATMLQRTRIGKAMRAVSDNRDLAESSGIDVDRVVVIVWVVGAALAALGGILFGSAVAVDWFMGFRLLLLMFAGVILGGLGTAYGAMVGSLVVGLVTELSVLWFPAELKFMWALAVLIIVLLVRPQGILGQRERIG
jgi:neutral amino acid transport system permease protein